MAKRRLVCTFTSADEEMSATYQAEVRRLSKESRTLAAGEAAWSVSSVSTVHRGSLGGRYAPVGERAAPALVRRGTPAIVLEPVAAEERGGPNPANEMIELLLNHIR